LVGQERNELPLFGYQPNALPQPLLHWRDPGQGDDDRDRRRGLLGDHELRQETPSRRAEDLPLTPSRRGGQRKYRKIISIKIDDTSANASHLFLIKNKNSW